jgi:hypothetical protein
MNRRNLLRTTALALPVALLSACATTPGGTPAIPVPTLDQAKTWSQTIANELPIVEATLKATGTISAKGVEDFDIAVAKLNALMPTVQGLQPGNTVAIIFKDVSDVMVAVALLIPASAPFAPFLSIGLAVIEGYLASQPAMVAGRPISAEPPPVAAAHRAAVSRPAGR